MDSFTLAVVVADIVMVLAFITLLILDRPHQTPPAEPVRPAGKRRA